MDWGRSTMDDGIVWIQYYIFSTIWKGESKYSSFVFFYGIPFTIHANKYNWANGISMDLGSVWWFKNQLTYCKYNKKIEHSSITSCRIRFWLKFNTSKWVYKNALFFYTHCFISLLKICVNILSRISKIYYYRFNVQHILRSMNHNSLNAFSNFVHEPCWLLIFDTINVQQFEIEE